jgi:hypothetical protein
VSVILRMGVTGNRLTVSFDGEKIDSALILAYLGEIRRFTWHGRSFALRVKGLGLSGELALFMDGNEITPNAARDSVVPQNNRVPTPPNTPAPRAPQFQREINVVETDEVIGVEEYPLDNRFGDAALTTDRQISKASTNECSVETSGQVNANVSAEILAVIKAEIAGQLSKQTSSKVGEAVTESQTLHLSVGPRAAVLYRVLWNRRVRAGQRVYQVGTGEITMPYRMTFGLTC